MKSQDSATPVAKAEEATGLQICVASLLAEESGSSSPASQEQQLYETLSHQQKMTLDLMQQTFRVEHGHSISIVKLDHGYYFIGIQLAKLLKRETSNLYRSFKRHGIELQRATTNQLQWLNSLNIIHVNKTHSVTFVPFLPTLDYLMTVFRKRRAVVKHPREYDSFTSVFESKESRSLSSSHPYASTFEATRSHAETPFPTAHEEHQIATRPPLSLGKHMLSRTTPALPVHTMELGQVPLSQASSSVMSGRSQIDTKLYHSHPILPDPSQLHLQGHWSPASQPGTPIHPSPTSSFDFDFSSRIRWRSLSDPNSSSAVAPFSTTQPPHYPPPSITSPLAHPGTPSSTASTPPHLGPPQQWGVGQPLTSSYPWMSYDQSSLQHHFGRPQPPPK